MTRGGLQAVRRWAWMGTDQAGISGTRKGEKDFPPAPSIQGRRPSSTGRPLPAERSNLGSVTSSVWQEAVTGSGGPEPACDAPPARSVPGISLPVLPRFGGHRVFPPGHATRPLLPARRPTRNRRSPRRSTAAANGWASVSASQAPGRDWFNVRLRATHTQVSPTTSSTHVAGSGTANSWIGLTESTIIENLGAITNSDSPTTRW